MLSALLRAGHSLTVGLSGLGPTDNILMSYQYLPFSIKPGLWGKRRWATVPFSYHTTRSDCIARFGCLTAGSVRHSTSPLSWRPASAGQRQRAKLPETRHYGLMHGKA